MYSSRGSNSYGQQSYAAQSSYGQNPTSAYPGNSAVGSESVPQLSIASRHSSMIAGPLEADIGGYRAHPTSSTHYGAQYSSLYASASLSSGQQGSSISTKGAGPSALEGRSGYGSTRQESPKYAPSEYVSSSSHGYGHKNDRLISEKMPDYPSVERRQYGDRQSAYIGRDLPTEAAGRYADTVSYAHQHQPEVYNRLDQAVLRQEHVLKSQSVQPTSHDGVSRQADYLAARSGTFRHSTQNLDSYGGRDADPHGLPLVSRSSYGGQHTSSILGAAPQRNVDDLMFAQGSSNPGYGVSLPPGREYGVGKGLHGTTLEMGYPGSIPSFGLLPRVDDRKNERGEYARELELREEERRKERLREREKEREREKRERERERDRERERERERERKYILELREERDRERRRGPEIRRERTPPRVSKDRHVPSIAKDGKLLRRDSPRHEALHRLHSPVKEKRREYVCKVYTSTVVIPERDYLSVDKRYPKLYISPDFSKLIVNWPRGNMKLSMNTPVSFEHDFVEEENGAKQKEESTVQLDTEPVNSGHKTTIWNAKMILMSGLSKSAVEELSSDKIYNDRVPHVCNFLRFAVLRRGHSFMAIGGPWDPIDGGDPSVDSSLVRTAMRYAKDVTHLDLEKCQQWNRFLEIHYDRVGRDGLFSHKEITVLFVPDLSDCLPSLDAWREQWLAHKKAVAEQERQHSLKKEKVREKDDLKGKEINPSNDGKRAEKSQEKKDTVSSGHVEDVVKKDEDDNSVKVDAAEEGGDGSVKKSEKNEGIELGGGVKNVEKKEEGNNTGNQDGVKPGKKKIVRRIVRQKVSDKKATAENENKDKKKMDEDIVDKNVKTETADQQDSSSADPPSVKTFTRKKVLKKVSEGEPAQKEDKNVESDLKEVMHQDSLEDNSQGKLDLSSAAVVRDGTVKKTIKRKIIKRVPKLKVTSATANNDTTNSKCNDSKEGKVPHTGNETEIVGKAMMDEDKKTSGDSKLEKNLTSKRQSSGGSGENQNNVSTSSKTENMDIKIVKKEEEGAHEKRFSGPKPVKGGDEEKVSPKNHDDSREKSKDRKEKKERDGTDEKRSKTTKDVEKKKSEEPPRHPGLILRTKSGKDQKMRSLSLSLDSLLDYSDKDIEESTFELSLFAESLYEMLQYQMGCRLLTFLQQLRIKFVNKRNLRKRQRVETSEKKTQKNASTKRLKSDEPARQSNSEMKAEAHQEEKLTAKEGKLEADGMDKVKLETEVAEKPKMEENEEIVEEDPEEDPEDDEEMEDASSEQVEEDDGEGNDDSDANPEQGGDDGNGPGDELAEEKADEKDAETRATSDAESKPRTDAGSDKEEVKFAAAKKETPVKKEAVVDKELLQAFRFFDRNRVGYIRVEDMRLILHNLGKYLSHRDVKELAQSALLESNTGRDDRILYEELVRGNLISTSHKRV